MVCVCTDGVTVSNGGPGHGRPIPNSWGIGEKEEEEFGEQL